LICNVRRECRGAEEDQVVLGLGDQSRAPEDEGTQKDLFRHRLRCPRRVAAEGSVVAGPRRHPRCVQRDAELVRSFCVPSSSGARL